MLRTSVLLLAAACGFSTATPASSGTGIGASFAQARRKATQVVRHLQSDECDADTTAIFERSLELRQAARAFNPEYETAVQSCESDNVCTIDEDTFAATPDFVRECEAAGGVIFEYDMVVNCKIFNMVESLEVIITYLNVDHCYSPNSCDREAIADQAAQEANYDLGQFETVFTDEIVKAICSVDYKVSDTNGNTVAADKIQGNGAGVTSMTGIALSVLASTVVTMVYI